MINAEGECILLEGENIFPRRNREIASSGDQLIIINLDSLSPEYLALNSDASGPGKQEDWLMPNVRRFVMNATYWSNAEGHFPHATDSNHLNILAGTNAGLTGVYGVVSQVESWTLGGMEVGRIHLAKARYPDGSQVLTLFDLVEEQTRGKAVTAFLSNKNWVPVQYGADFGKPASVDIVLNGTSFPSFLPAPNQPSFYDNPSTDPDWFCDPESPLQTNQLDSVAPRDHPRDIWVVKAALEVLERNHPAMMYVLLGDLDLAGHNLGTVRNPDEWIVGPVPKLPPGCQQKAKYRLVSRRNPKLFKEPRLDLIRDVDLAFGFLINSLKSRPESEQTTVILASDHGMENYFEQVVNPAQVLQEQGLLPERHSFLDGRGPVGAAYWRPAWLKAHPTTVEQAKAALLSESNRVMNPETGLIEIPWNVIDRFDMQWGRPDLNLDPMEFYNPYFVDQGVWPDLVVITKPGWRLVSRINQNAGHGSQTTAPVALAAIQGLNFPPGQECSEPAQLADVAVTIADRMNWILPFSTGKSLTCEASSRY